MIDNETNKTKDFSGQNLSGMSLGHVNLDGANLRGCDLSFAHLGCSSLRGADLRNANLRHANLGAADLTGADLRYADMRSANTEGTILVGADLRECIREETDHFPAQVQIPHFKLEETEAYIQASKEGFHPLKHWGSKYLLPTGEPLLQSPLLWPQIKKKLGRLVFGDSQTFREVRLVQQYKHYSQWSYMLSQKGFERIVHGLGLELRQQDPDSVATQKLELSDLT